MCMMKMLAAIGALLPAATFMAALVYLDSYKLVRVRAVLAVMVAGAATALIAYVINGYLVRELHLDIDMFSRYIAPVSEELLKGALIVLLVRGRRIGFLVDAAILG